MLLHQPLVPTIELRMLLAQCTQPLLQRSCLPLYLRPMPCAGEPSWQEHQHRQDEAQHDRASYNRALVT